MIIETRSAKETYQLGVDLGKKACKGQVFTMVGDLGVGKTVFTQGLAEGLGITEPISSPTFTIVQEYRNGRLPLFHFDLYRIHDEDELFEAGCEEYIYGEGVSIIEWADLCWGIIPDDAIVINIAYTANEGERIYELSGKDEE